MRPSFIHDLADFQQIVQFGSTPESLFLEFKRGVRWHVPRGTPEGDKLRRDTAKEFTRDVVQFANALGGCLLIGVDEQPGAPGSPFKVADKVESVADPQALIQWAEEAIKNFLVPHTFTRVMDHVVFQGGKRIVAINVPPSRHAVALWDDQQETMEYVTRTNHGKTRLNPDEVERQLMNGASRFGKIAIHEVADSGPNVDLTSGVWWRTGDGEPPAPLEVNSVHLGQPLEDAVFELRISIPGETGIPLVKVPYSLVRDAWVVAPGLVGILLGARIVLANGRMFLEPF